MKKLNLVPTPFPLESGRGMKSHKWEIYDWKKSLKSIWRKHSSQRIQDDKSILNWETE